MARVLEQEGYRFLGAWFDIAGQVPEISSEKRSPDSFQDPPAFPGVK